MNTVKEHGYTQDFYSPMPTRTTRFWRTCILWQAVRFVVLNLKVLKIVVKGHS
jgi:hypothetical protein